MTNIVTNNYGTPSTGTAGMTTSGNAQSIKADGLFELQNYPDKIFSSFNINFPNGIQGSKLGSGEGTLQLGSDKKEKLEFTQVYFANQQVLVMNFKRKLTTGDIGCYGMCDFAVAKD